MRQVSEREIENRLRLDNPWWEAGAGIDPEYAAFPRRAYLPAFTALVRQVQVRRAVVLLGPRRVGKTILAYHCIQNLVNEGVASGRDVLYLSLETPLFTGLTLDNLLERFRRLFVRPAGTMLYVFFDEIQYLRDWATHLKSLVDTHRDCRFVATGSAAAALKTRSAESGAGRFTEFVLPPLTFAEYLRFVRRESGGGLPDPAHAPCGPGRRALQAHDDLQGVPHQPDHAGSVVRPGRRAARGDGTARRNGRVQSVSA
jgi:hypothetical protein